MMASLRFLSSFIEFGAACLFLYFNDVKKALVINTLLAGVGPVILLLTMMVGLYAIADQFSLQKLSLIFLGIGCILWAVIK
ncbi:hypothetical protein BFG57_07335 [Bacillus solimangrovi]|uniref:DUF2619 domain-containing protein n=2 Tax=Bacillus solimangrovi TaxID=1305675 RepID=A0A1E5LKG0_9BACI|nr:hypothetical protein BFG57_07335 [Bacillus solimangrovi]